jgi:hypothetical protein
VRSRQASSVFGTSRLTRCSVAPVDFWFSEIILTTYPNHQYTAFVPSQYEGRFAIVTSAGWDAVDADAPLTNGADAYGEVVWSRRPDAGVKLRKGSRLAR